jgi:hypothetical protein
MSTLLSQGPEEFRAAHWPESAPAGPQRSAYPTVTLDVLQKTHPAVRQQRNGEGSSTISPSP